MQLWEYVFPIGLPLYVPQNGVFRGFEGEAVKILSSDPQKALPCVNTSADVSHVKIGSTAWAPGRLKNFAYKEEIKKIGW